MKLTLKKVKTEHTILSEFIPFLRHLEQIVAIQRIIPGRIAREQKSSSDLRFNLSYLTSTGWKGKMSKGSTSQEIFIITKDRSPEFKTIIASLRNNFISG